MLKLTSSKGKAYDISWAATMYTDTQTLAIQFEDSRDISVIAREFENCEWFEWETLGGETKREDGYSKIKNIGRPQYVVNPIFVQVMLIKTS